MGVARLACFVDDHLGGHTAQFEPFDLLPVEFENGVVGIGQAYKGQIFLFPIVCKSLFIIRADDDDLGISFYETVVLMTQLRHVLPAVWSHESPVEYQDDVFLALIVGETYCLSLEIVQGKIRGGCIDRYSVRHGLTSSMVSWYIDIILEAVHLPNLQNLLPCFFAWKL